MEIVLEGGLMKLALHGGDPVRKTPIYYGHQYIDETDCRAVLNVLLSDFLTTGPMGAELEKKMAAVTGAPFCVVLANGTAALHAACFAAGIKEGDEVITTPLTFAASANCILYCGGAPVFAVVYRDSYAISPASIREHLSPRTKAVIAVDFAGQAAQLDEIKDICRQHNLVFIEDAAHSLGTQYNGQSVGSIADMTTFSFHPVKTVTGGEGGAVVTNHEAFDKKIRLFRSHGITRNAGEMAQDPEGPWYYEQIELGYNYRLTDFQAALIMSQLDKLDHGVEDTNLNSAGDTSINRVKDDSGYTEVSFAARRKAIVQRYRQALTDMPEIVLQKEIPQSDTVWHLFVIQLKLELLKCGRREFYDALAAENVIPNVHYIPVYYLPYYQKLGYRKGLCPNAEYLYERILSLPLYYAMSDDDVESVIQALQKVVTHYRI
ncbi:MAG: aminotransferase class I/II-fold pyridoxal phosphate-dependent enzyme [Gracilibacteraceae bacterium]|jgi:dTDP-4-amino-4,6-dideoxygalactose transaminase|nr:aminotransferase class I/II-fold pyridoxal phosphate-dependent enzyme [Gracilibacteraceae bacterium]